MIKSSIIALVTVAALAGVAAPAFASDDNGDLSNTLRGFNAETILSNLQQEGVQATSVEDWNGLIRVYVTQPDGTQAMEFFTPGTLKPVAL